MTQNQKPSASHRLDPHRHYEGPNVFLRLCNFLLLYPWTGLLCLVLVCASNVFSLIGPHLSGSAIDAIHYDSATGVANVDFPTVFRYCFYMAIFYVLSALLAYLLSIVMTHFPRRSPENSVTTCIRNCSPFRSGTLTVSRQVTLSAVCPTILIPSTPR